MEKSFRMVDFPGAVRSENHAVHAGVQTQRQVGKNLPLTPIDRRVLNVGDRTFLRSLWRHVTAKMLRFGWVGIDL